MGMRDDLPDTAQTGRQGDDAALGVQVDVHDVGLSYLFDDLSESGDVLRNAELPLRTDVQ
jgi:hypothetical protein